MNFGRKMMKAGVAAVAAIATLGAGGVVASTAFAGGGGGNQPGTGGDLAAVQFWQYKDDASGAWGPATSLDSVRAAMFGHDHPVQRRVEDRERERHRDPALAWR